MLMYSFIIDYSVFLLSCNINTKKNTLVRKGCKAKKISANIQISIYLFGRLINSCCMWDKHKLTFFSSTCVSCQKNINLKAMKSELKIRICHWQLRNICWLLLLAIFSCQNSKTDSAYPCQIRWRCWLKTRSKGIENP